MHRQGKCWDSFNSSKSDTNIIPPWCSSGKLSRRKLVPKCEIQSSYPLRENIWDYLNDDGENLKSGKRRRKVSKHKKGKTKLAGIVLSLVLAGALACLLRFGAIPASLNLMDELISRTKLLSLVDWKPSVGEECCHKMRYLTLELSRAEHNLRYFSVNYLWTDYECFMIIERGQQGSHYGPRLVWNSRRLRWVTRNQPVSDPHTDRVYIKGAVATRGSNTKEWGSRVALWGIVPLWKAAPPANTVLSLRTPTPSDCWPFTGSSGELIIDLPTVQQVSSVSIEHVRPDTAKSALKNFIVYGILANNTMAKLIKSQYQRNGPAKQYFNLATNPFMRSLIFRVFTNHGNTKYTCVYRIHLYSYITN